MLKATINWTEAGQRFEGENITIQELNASIGQIICMKRREGYDGSYYKTKITLHGEYKNEPFSYELRMDITGHDHEPVTVTDHIVTGFRYYWKNWRNKKDTMAKMYREIAKGQIAALRLLQEANATFSPWAHQTTRGAA